MEIRAFGYLGLGSSKPDDWTSFASDGLGMAALDLCASVRAFQMDDRKQRLAALLPRRLDSANRAVIELKRQLETGESRRVVGQTIEKAEPPLSSGASASLVYAGYPYDPFAPDQSKH